MRHFQLSNLFATTLMFACLLPNFRAAAAQQAADTDWQNVRSRLQAIYERGEFRPRSMLPSWLPDSSGFVIQQRDEATGRRTPVRYDVQTGQPLADSEGATQSPRGEDGAKRKQRRDFERKLAEQLRQQPGGEQLGIYGWTWSPDGQRVAFVESDSSKVKRRAVLVPSDPSYPGVDYLKFARVGEEISKLRVGVAGVDSAEVQWLKIQTPPEGYYLGRVEWAGNSDEVLVEKLSRFRNERKFLLAQPDGKVQTIFSETDDAWVVASQGKNLGLTWIDDGQAFIVVSEKDGWRHAFVYSREGEELRLLTPGDYDIIDRAIVDEAGGWFYFYASPNNGTQKYLHRVPLDGSGKLERITPVDQQGTHDYSFSPDAQWGIHTYSTIDTPPVVELVELPSHRVVRVLEDNAILASKMKEIVKQPTEFITLEIDGGISMDAWMIKPSDFDESKKYPVFVYVYGEPHAQTVLDQWGAAHIDFHRVVADLGYIVVSIDNRGTPAPKGAAWRRAVFGSLGPLSTEEQAAGLKALAETRPYVDLSRVGIWGWSGGGSNTLNAMFRKPDSYHVGIAVVPKPQPHLYNAWFQEIFMETRETNPDGYERAAAINFAEGLRGKLLIVTGSGETNTHIQIIEGLVDRLIELGKPFDYMVYPNRDHGLRKGAGTTVHVRTLIVRYLLEHLPAGGR